MRAAAPPLRKHQAARGHGTLPCLDCDLITHRYGRLAQEAGRRFASVYAMQDTYGLAFDTPKEMLKAMGLYDLTQQNAADHLKVRRGAAGRTARDALRNWR